MHVQYACMRASGNIDARLLTSNVPLAASAGIWQSAYHLAGGRPGGRMEPAMSEPTYLRARITKFSRYSLSTHDQITLEDLQGQGHFTGNGIFTYICTSYLQTDKDMWIKFLSLTAVDTRNKSAKRGWKIHKGSPHKFHKFIFGAKQRVQQTLLSKHFSCLFRFRCWYRLRRGLKGMHIVSTAHQGCPPSCPPQPGCHFL